MTRSGWEVVTAADASAAGEVAAEHIAAALRARLTRVDRATLALSGGSSPLPMLRALAADPLLPWDRVDVLQVDERAVPADDEDRNLRMQRSELLDHVPARVHPLAVEHPDGLEAGAAASAEALADLLGDGGRVDVVHLGIGDDGHTASLFPGSAVLGVEDRTVAATAEHAGHRRMTLTRPVLAAARATVLLVVGAAKREALERTLAGDPDIPAGALDLSAVTVVTDLPGLTVE